MRGPGQGVSISRNYWTVKQFSIAVLLPLAVRAMISNLNSLPRAVTSDGTSNCVTVGGRSTLSFPLDEELVSDDLDGARFADLGMRLGHRIPVDEDGLAHGRERDCVAARRRRNARHRDVGYRGRQHVAECHRGLEHISFKAPGPDVVRSVGEATEERWGIQFVELRLGALEK
jgi:hypothetical protein